MILYSLAAYVAELALPVAALFSRKMSMFVRGRKDIFRRMEAVIGKDDRVMWFHSASMGEFEEIRPIIDNVRNNHPEFRILVTFFSPSGYEVMKDWKGADWVFYLPVDTPSNARRFIKAAHPEVAVFSITDYWFNHLEAMRRHGTRAYVVSARLRPDKTIMKWYGFPYRNIVRRAFANVLTKDDASVELLRSFGYEGGIRCGDPRFDRVIKIAATPWEDSIVRKFKSDSLMFLAGSTVSAEDDDIAIALCNRYQDVKFLFVPHEMDPGPMKRIEDSVNGTVLRYSQCTEDTDFSQVRGLIVDCVGKLSRLYRYADWALVGGGFYKGLHSVIEASVYGIPVLTGPILYNNKPALEMAEAGINGVAHNVDEAIGWFDPLYRDSALRLEAGKKALDYCMRNKGATDLITGIILQASR